MSLLAGPLNREKAGGRERASEGGREDVPSGDELAGWASVTGEGGAGDCIPESHLKVSQGAWREERELKEDFEICI